ncbi:hypothetical protein AHiyo4_39930 [Arthrobacter sp. Hiyo4]|nr:hypothetical protein AHiyo4_39930 [Arthrobacter sp. Hiyo4]
MPQTRGIVPEPDVQRIKAALVLRDAAQQQVELAVADALKAGGSVREVAASTGIATSTVQKYGRAHGWPTSEQRAGWAAERERQDEFTARIEAASAILAHLGVNEDGQPDL